MDYRELYRDKCMALRNELNILYEFLGEIKEKLIVIDFKDYLDRHNNPMPISVGNNLVNYNHIEEITINKEVLNVFSRINQKIVGFVFILDHPFKGVDFWVEYKGEKLLPDVERYEDEILEKYNKNEIIEIIDIIDEKIKLIKIDINYIKFHNDLSSYKHHYGKYNRGFKSEIEFINIDAVIDYYNR